jgi:Mg-chelatase subunit ChlD
MKYCRVTKRVVPETATICPHCGTATCLSTFGASAATSSPPRHAEESPQSRALAESELQLKLHSLEGRVQKGQRRSAWLAATAMAAFLMCGLAWLLHYRATVLSYAELDPSIRLERDGTYPDRVAIIFRPRSPGLVGFHRTDRDRETEVLDRVDAAGTPEQRFDWRWAGVKKGDRLQVTHRVGWSLAQVDLTVPAQPPPFKLGNALVSGEVVDATNNRPLKGAEVRLVGTMLRATTGDDGRFRLADAPAGPVGIEISALNYSTDQLEKTLSAGAETSVRIALSPGMGAGQIRIVLTWGDTPADLDAHLQGPLPDGSKFHVFFHEKGDLKSKEFVSLDVDDNNGEGPETITVLGVLPGTYHYFVHDYTNRAKPQSQELAQSGAEVKVYQGGQTYRFSADQKSAGTQWHVCDIVVSASGSATVRKVDQYEFVPMKSNAPGTIVMLIDTSSSMEGLIGQAKRAAGDFLDALPFESGAKVGLISFGQPTSEIHGISQDRDSLKNAIAPLGAYGRSTPMEQGLAIAHKMLDGVDGSKVVIVFTDGKPDDLAASLAWGRILKASGSDIWAIGTAGADMSFLRQLASNPDKATFAAPQNLREVFRATAGKIYDPVNVER